MTEQDATSIHLEGQWRSPKDNCFYRETLQVALSKPLAKILPVRKWGQFRFWNDMRHLDERECLLNWMSSSQQSARETLLGAARAICFLDQTGLHPGGGRRFVWPRESGWYGPERLMLPHADHLSKWFDPETKQLFLLDDPYIGALSGQQQAERAAWAEKSGYHLVKLSWRGLYCPPRCATHLVAPRDTKLDVESLAARLNELSSFTLYDTWNGESIPMLYKRA